MESHDELLERASTVLKRARRHPDPATLVKMRAALDEAIEAPERPHYGFRWLLAGAGVAACAAVIFFVQTDRDPTVEVIAGQAIRSERSFALSQGAILRMGRATLTAGTDAQIELPVLTPQQMRLDLFDGQVELELDAGQAMLVATPLAEIRVLGTRFSVSADDERTEVSVAKGAVDVLELANRKVVRVSEGGRHSVVRVPAVAQSSEASRVPVVSPPPVVSHESWVVSPPVPARRSAKSRALDRALKQAKHAAKQRQDTIAEIEAVEPKVAEESEAQTPPIPLPPPEPSGDSRLTTHDSRLETPKPKVEATRKVAPAVIERLETLLRRADQERRDGNAKLAAALYQEVADHPDGESFAEEALFRKAELHARAGQVQASLQSLAEAERRFGRGELAPERSALAARIHLDEGDALAASRALSGVPEHRATLEVVIIAVDVARELAGDHPCDALRLLSLVHRPKELRLRAEELRRNIGTRCTKSP